MGDGVNLFADQAAQYEILNAVGYTPAEAALTGGWGLMPPSSYTPGDLNDAAKVNAGMPMPAGSEGLSFWQRFAMFGAGKIIDNAAPVAAAINGNTSNGSFAGANGRTYQTTNGQRQQAAVQQGTAQPQSVSPVMLIAAAAVAYLALA